MNFLYNFLLQIIHSYRILSKICRLQAKIGCYNFQPNFPSTVLKLTLYAPPRGNSGWEKRKKVDESSQQEGSDDAEIQVEVKSEKCIKKSRS